MNRAVHLWAAVCVLLSPDMRDAIEISLGFIIYITASLSRGSFESRVDNHEFRHYNAICYLHYQLLA